MTSLSMDLEFECSGCGQDIIIKMPIDEALTTEISTLTHEDYARFMKTLVEKRQKFMGTSEDDNPTISANSVVIARERYDYLLNCEARLTVENKR